MTAWIKVAKLQSCSYISVCECLEVMVDQVYKDAYKEYEDEVRMSAKSYRWGYYYSWRFAYRDRENRVGPRPQVVWGEGSTVVHMILSWCRGFQLITLLLFSSIPCFYHLYVWNLTMTKILSSPRPRFKYLPSASARICPSSTTASHPPWLQQIGAVRWQWAWSVWWRCVKVVHYYSCRWIFST